MLIFESSHHHDSKGAIVKIHSAITIVLLWSGLTFANAQPAARSTSEGVFTDEQAQRGAMAYSKNCAGCHGSALRSTDREVPNLTGESFKRWVGGTLGEKFEMVRDTMPPRDERSLPDEVYLTSSRSYSEPTKYQSAPMSLNLIRKL